MEDIEEIKEEKENKPSSSPNKEEKITSKTVQEIEDQTENIKKIEAALFISGRFLNLQELITLTDINPLLIKELMEKLDEKYSQDDTAISIIKKEDMWKMDVKPEFVSIINKLATGSSEFTKAEQETLAIIAYKQPVKQSIIIKIRGNKAYEHIRSFINLGLLKAKKSGHTLELTLSEEFYDYFHVRAKEENKVEKIVEEMEEDEGNKEIEWNKEKEGGQA